MLSIEKCDRALVEMSLTQEPLGNVCSQEGVRAEMKQNVQSSLLKIFNNSKDMSIGPTKFIEIVQ